MFSHWYDLTRKNPGASGIQTPDLPLPRHGLTSWQHIGVLQGLLKKNSNISFMFSDFIYVTLTVSFLFFVVFFGRGLCLVLQELCYLCVCVYVCVCVCVCVCCSADCLNVATHTNIFPKSQLHL